jgi:diguanylate cyclase (GGDEF)-like protein
MPKTYENIFLSLTGLLEKALDQVANIQCLERLPSDFLEDSSKIQVSCQKLLSLIEKHKKAPTQHPEGEKFWSKARHDLRGAIGTIRGYTDLSLDMLEDEDLPESYHTPYQTLCAITEDMIALMDRMREYSAGAPSQASESELKEAQEKYNATEPKTILVIDDDTFKLDLLSRHLHRIGHHVILSESGEQGLKVLSEKAEEVDLILLDMLMPGMNGYEVLECLKNNKRTNNIPVLIISSVGDIESISKCIEAGAEDYLPIPFNLTLLYARVKSCLDKKSLQDKIEKTRLQLDAALQSMEEGFAVFDKEDRLILANTRFCRLYSVSAEQVSQNLSYRSWLENNFNKHLYLEHKRDKENKTPKAQRLEKRLQQHISRKSPVIDRLYDGRWIEVIESPTPDGGTVSIHKDITLQKSQEEDLAYRATHDQLTGLYNRAAFEEALELSLKNAKKEKKKFALLYLDLDEFKAINDTFGHDFGDEVLIHVSRKIEQCLRNKDIKARLGGDEFAAILNNIESSTITETLAKRLLDAVGDSINHQGQKAKFGVSIGIACFPNDGLDEETLIKRADEAMYRAKKAGKHSFRLASGE